MPAEIYARLRARHGKPDHGPTRRDMLKLAIAGSAGLLLSTQGCGFGKPKAKRILIVGGGFAGLAAAHELTALGYDVHVFEARPRIGGRVFTFIDMANGPVEGGAELIGSNHPTWIAYKEKFGLTFRDVTEEKGVSPVVLDGKRLADGEGEKIFEEMESAYSAMTDLARPVNADQPWTMADAQVLDNRTTGAWIDALKLSDRARRVLHAEFAADNGVVTSAQSQLGNLVQIKGGGLERYWTDTEVFRCAEGNQAMATKLAQALPADRLRLTTEVRKIETTAAGARVTLNDGAVVEGDDVVLAVPPSVWVKIDFTPALHPLLWPQMGRNVKYLAVVKSKFWQQGGGTPNMFSDGPVNLTWEATQNQPGPGVVLTCFSGADDADTCRSWVPGSRDDGSRDAKYIDALTPAFPGIDREFVRGRFMNWPSDPWTMASYSFPAPGQITTQGQTLREGIGRLHFAGEHTNYAFVGYMEGALGSGVALAKRLAVRDGLVKAAV